MQRGGSETEPHHPVRASGAPRGRFLLPSRGVLGLAIALALSIVALAGPSSSASAAEPLCTDTWSGPGEGNWQTATDWSTGQVPTSTDVACIGAGDTVEVSGGATQVGLVAGEGSLIVSGATLELDSGLESSRLTSLTLSNASLVDAETLVISGSFASDGDVQVEGTGSLVVGSKASATVGNSHCSRLQLDAVTFSNQGTVAFGSSPGSHDGTIDLEEGAQLQNAGTFTDDSSEPGGCGFGSGPSIANSGGSAASFVNTGTLIAEAGEEPVAITVPLTNLGKAEAHSGALQLGGGGSGEGAVWSAAAGATLAFTGGTFSLDEDTWSGQGTIGVQGASVTATKLTTSGASAYVSGGTLSIPEGSSSSLATLSLSNGTLSLAGQLNVATAFNTNGHSTISGEGKLLIEGHANGTIDAGGCSLLALEAVNLVNDGNLTLGEAAGSADGALALGDGAQLHNAGSFSDDSFDPGCGFGYGGNSIVSLGGATPSIVNTGSFLAQGTQEPLNVNIPYDSEGTTEAKSGALELQGGGSATNATWSASSGATLAFAGNSFTLTGGSWSGEGTVSVQSANVTASALHVSASTSFQNGSFTVPQGAEVTVGGPLKVSGGFTVAGPGRFLAQPGSSTSTAGNCAHLALENVTYVNQGAFTLAPGSAALWLQDGTQLQNTGTFLDRSEDPGCGYGSGGSSIYQGPGATPTLIDSGLFKVEGEGQALKVEVPFENQGTTEAKSGTLQLTAGGTSTNATWSAGSGAEVTFSGSEYAITGGNWSGSGTISVQGASLTASGLHVSATTVLDGGQLTIPTGAEVQLSSAVGIQGSFTVGGTGTLVSEPGSSLTTDGDCAHLALEDATYLNKGSFTLAAGSAALWLQDGAQLQNDGAFLDQSEDPGCGYGSGGSSIYQGPGAAPALIDSGTFRAEGATLKVAVPFEDQGTVEARSGTLQLDGDIANNKLMYVAAGAQVSVTGNYTEGENGTLKLGVASPTSFGSLSVGGASALDGLLELSATAGFIGEVGQSFQVLSSAAESGAFSYVAGSGLPSGGAYQAEYSNTGVSLLIVNAEGRVPVPVLSTPPRITAGSVQQGQTLVLSHGSWEHVPSQYVDQWLRCSEAGHECEPIAGAGGQEYVTTRSDVGHTIVVQEIARNAGGESVPADSGATAPVTALPLHAVAGENIGTFTGAEVTLDGAASTPAAEINSYHWEFGDGESAGGAVARHVYRSAGTYTATLTISRGGEQNTQSLTVNVVTPPGAAHAADVTLTDANENPITEAEILYSAANGTRTEATTNSRGEGDLAGLPEGEDTVYVYKSGFRPATGIVNVDSEHQGFTNITLEPGEVASTGLSSHELSFNEIVEAGIDPSEPANQTVDSFEAKLEFAGSITVELHGDINSEGEFAGGSAPTGTVTPPEKEVGGSPSPLKCEQQGANPEHTACETTVSSPSGETTRIIAKPATIETHPVIQWLILRGSAVTVKQFFEVSMVVQNLSPEEPFGLTEGTATLNLPDGMSLAPTAEPQALSQPVSSIPPLGAAESNWIIRGDAPGEYTPSVDYQAQLEPFGTSVSTQAALAQPLEVWGANALSTVLKVDSGPAEPGIPYHVTLGVKNVSNIPLYNVAVNTSAPQHNHFILQPEQQFTSTVGELRPGQTVFAPSYILITQSPHEIFGEIKEGKLIGESYAELQSATLAGETSTAPPTVERVSPPTLYEASSSSAGAGSVHLQWHQVPGAEGYEVFSTSSLGAPFGESPLATLPASASSVDVSGSSSDYFAISTLIDGRLVLDHPLVEAGQAERERKEKEEEEERKKEEEQEKERERHESEEQAKKEKHLGKHSESEPESSQCESGDSINCANGNHTETQTDLSVGGHGPSLSLTRTYNSLQAVRQSKAGPFGYGWTGPYGAYITVSRWCDSVNSSCNEGELGSGYAVVHQVNGSTVFFSKRERAGAGKEGWEAGPLVQSTLTEAGGRLIFRLPTGHTLNFNISGHVSSRLGPLKFFTWTEGTVPVSSEEDRNGNALTFSYNASGQLTTIADASARKITLAYDSEGQVTSASDPMGHTVKYGYEHGDLVSVTEPGETTPRLKFAYNTANEMTSETEGGTHTSTTEYDSSHRAIAQTDAMGRKRTWKYLNLESGPQTTITEPSGSTTVEQFSPEGSPTSVTHAYGTSLASTTSSEYNSQEELVSSTDPEGRRTSYGYDAAGNRTSETDPLGNVSKWSYNAEHEIVGETRPNGEATTIVRDANGNETEVSRPAPGGTTQASKYVYGSDGDMTSMTDSLGHTWHYTYDANGDRVSETDPDGNERTFSYDEDSNLIASVSPLGNVAGAKASSFTTSTERDAQGRTIKTTNPLGRTTKTTYNADAQIATTTEADGNTTTYTYDADDEPIKVAQANGSTQETEYDAAGEVTARIDGDHHKTSYVRNALGQVTEVIDPLGQRTTKSYYPGGELETETDPEGHVITYSYDGDDRATKVAYSGGVTPTVEYEYDVDGNRVKMLDGSGTTSYTYDQLDRLTETVDGHSDRTSYTYNLADEQTKIVYPNGQALVRSFDADGHLTGVTDWLGNATTFAYNADSQQTTTVFPHASENEDVNTYNDAGELTKTVMKKGKKTIASLAYTRAKNGQVTKTTSKDLPGVAKDSYTYDSGDRLTAEASTAYTYDAANNPVKIGTTTNTFNANDELTSTSAGVTYTYNEEGERIKARPASGPVSTYTYNQAGEMLAVSRPDEGSTPPIEQSYTYNGDGLRVSQTSSGATAYLTWDITEPQPMLLAEGSTSFIYGPGELPVEQLSSEGKVLYMHHDEQGSTRLLTGATGSVEGSATYDAYGNLLAVKGSASSDLGYDGQLTDSATGLVYLRARSYDPASAQFMSVDPAVESTGAPYSYASDDPINAGDPSGMCGDGSVHAVLESVNPFSEENCAYQTFQALGGNASALSQITGVLAIAATATGVGAPLGAALEAVSVATGAYATSQDVAQGKGLQAALDGLGTVLGGGALADRFLSALEESEALSAKSLAGLTAHAQKALELRELADALDRSGDYDLAASLLSTLAGC